MINKPTMYFHKKNYSVYIPHLFTYDNGSILAIYYLLPSIVPIPSCAQPFSQP